MMFPELRMTLALALALVVFVVVTIEAWTLLKRGVRWLFVTVIPAILDKLGFFTGGGGL